MRVPMINAVDQGADASDLAPDNYRILNILRVQPGAP